MVALEGIHAAYMAQNGDLGPLLARLKDSDLSPSEKKFIEDRLLNRKGGQITRGPKASRAIEIRNQEILIADAWLYLRFGMKSASNRYETIADSIPDISQGGVRKIIGNTTPSFMTKFAVQHIQKIAFVFGQADDDSLDKPAILRPAPNLEK